MLRNRLYLNLIPFAVILIAVVAYAVIVFSQLASNVGTTIADNYQSDSAAQKMADALARMDAALQASRTQDKASARLVVDTSTRDFEEGLRSLFTNTATLAQANVLFQLRTNYQSLQAVGREMFAPKTSPQSRASSMTTTWFPPLS